MSELKKPLLVLKASQRLKKEQKDDIKSHLIGLANEIGAEAVVLDCGLEAELHQDVSVIAKSIDNLMSKLEAHTEASNKMIEITAHLLQALAEQEKDGIIDDGADTYLNGQPRA